MCIVFTLEPRVHKLLCEFYQYPTRSYQVICGVSMNTAAIDDFDIDWSEFSAAVTISSTVGTISVQGNNIDPFA